MLGGPLQNNGTEWVLSVLWVKTTTRSKRTSCIHPSSSHASFPDRPSASEPRLDHSYTSPIHHAPRPLQGAGQGAGVHASPTIKPQHLFAQPPRHPSIHPAAILFSTTDPLPRSFLPDSRAATSSCPVSSCAVMSDAAPNPGPNPNSDPNPNPSLGVACRCEVCGVSGYVSNFYSPRFCSRECRYERNKGNHVLPRPDIGIITCRECGKVGSSTEFFSAKYCSKKCRYERGGRPPPQPRSDDAGATGDSSAALDLRRKEKSAKRDSASQRLSISDPADMNAYAPRSVGLPTMAPASSSHVSTFHQLHASAAATAIDSTANQIAATFAANWQLLVDHQPRDRDHTASFPYLLDAVAALQESIVGASLECVRAETLLEATTRRLQELDEDIGSCIRGANDASSVEDRKSYYDIVRKMWVDKALLQKDEIRLLEQLRKQQELKNKLRTQLLDKQQALLTLGLTVSNSFALGFLEAQPFSPLSRSCPGAHAGARWRPAPTPKSTQYSHFDRTLTRCTALSCRISLIHKVRCYAGARPRLGCSADSRVLQGGVHSSQTSCASLPLPPSIVLQRTCAPSQSLLSK